MDFLFLHFINELLMSQNRKEIVKLLTLNWGKKKDYFLVQKNQHYGNSLAAACPWNLISTKFAHIVVLYLNGK